VIKRIFSSLLQEYLRTFPVVAVVGSRQVGKSTLVRQPEIGESRKYLTLDDIGLLSVAQSDPKGFLSVDEGLLTIDEAQLAPGLLREIKRLVDDDRKPGRFLLTGSADMDHCADLSSILAGRVGILHLPPITISEQYQSIRWREWLEADDARALDKAFGRQKSEPFAMERILSGGYPDSLLARSVRARGLWMDSFRTTYLERDLRRICDIGNLAEFARLMQLAAAATGGLLNQANLARDAGMSPATAGRHLSILEASFLLTRLPPFFANIGKRMVKAPKLYWNDTGLAANLCGLHSVGSLRADSRMLGRLFETLVMMEVKALLPLAADSARLFHVRTHDGLEVDGLVEIGRRHLPFEIKASQTVTAEDAEPIERWIALNPGHGPGVVLHGGDDFLPLSRNVRAIPVSTLFCQ
jgi:predicted AAA+ superfamily ATPase